MDQAALRSDLRRLFGRVPIPDELRDDYAAFVLTRQEHLTVPALVVGTAVMVGFLAVDVVIIPDIVRLALVIRVGICLPIAAAVYLYLSHARRSLLAHHLLASAVALIYGALACIIATSSSHALAPMYLTANNIAIMFVVLIIGFPPALAAGTAAMLIAIQEFVLAMSHFASFPLVFLTTGISLGIALPALYGNMRMDGDQRRAFLARHRDRERLRKLTLQNTLLERLSALDPLTGLSNRRGFDSALEAALAEAHKDPAGSSVALAMIDVDHFKLFNDTVGHVAGDDVLRRVSVALASAVRQGDFIARYGGEEFVVIMPDIKPESLKLIGARLRIAVEGLRIPHPASPVNRIITVSIGIAHADRSVLPEISPPVLVKAADDALYGAKAAGRNRAVVCDCTTHVPAFHTAVHKAS